ncbi:hypothetical protein EMCRGX_G033879 [Ephydatia muelleri]|eukprot:Em0022g361a
MAIRCSHSGGALCWFIIRVLYWVPVLFAFLIILWGYYVYAYVLNISGQFPKGSPLVNVFFLAVGHCLLFLQIASYVRTIATKHKDIPDEFVLSNEQLQQLEEAKDTQTVLQEIAKTLPIRTLTISGTVRYCTICEHIKPDRCHHCSMCKRCVLKMDHHCPWVNNCVGFSNYKYFVLFLFYTFLLALWFCITGLYDVIRAMKGTVEINPTERVMVIFCYFLCLLFGFSTSTLFGYHMYLVLTNKTTLEATQASLVQNGGRDKKLYWLGYKKNLQQVFGTRLLYGLLPIETSLGSGVCYPTYLDATMNLFMPAARNGAMSEGSPEEIRPLTQV